MNRRLIIVFGVLLTGLLVAWFLRHSPKAKEVDPSAEKPRLLSTTISTQVPKPVLADEKSAKKMEEDYIKLNDREIAFYGRAVDQHGEPVMDAEVVGSVLTPRGFTASVGEYKTRTDAAGNFQFNGLVGADIGIAIRKVGFEQDLRPGTRTSFNYSLMYGKKNLHHPDPSKPVIFNMWKLAGPEPMVTCQRKEYRVPSDGQATTFDLMTGEINVGSGDIRVTIWQKKPSAGVVRKGDWGYRIEAVEGGLVESTDRFMYLAPESGYQPQLIETLQASSTNWVDGIEKKLYLKSRGGRNCGRLTIKVWCDYDRPNTALRIESFLNPSGSRNLEYDPAKRIDPSRIAAVGLQRAIEEAKVREPNR